MAATRSRIAPTSAVPPFHVLVLGWHGYEVAQNHLQDVARVGVLECSVSPAQQRELTRRLASFDQDKPQAVTWEHLKAELAVRAS